MIEVIIKYSYVDDHQREQDEQRIEGFSVSEIERQFKKDYGYLKGLNVINVEVVRELA